jgi:hypothetical protein
MEVPRGEGQKFLNDPWNIQGFGEMDIRRKNAGKQRPSRDAGIAPQKMSSRVMAKHRRFQ